MPRNTPTLTLAEAEAILAGAKAKVLENGSQHEHLGGGPSR